MQIGIGGKFTKESFEEAFNIVCKLRSTLDLYSIDNISTNIEQLYYNPVVFSDEFEIHKKSHRSYSIKNKIEIVGVEIPFHLWATSNNIIKFRMFIEGLRKSILETSGKKIPVYPLDACIELCH